MGSLSMSTTRRETHLLKLVHPGGYVELHTTPILASQVLKNNPRHCVTRPDIFRFPWVVISPHSILTPGNVFFIVPCHTIRHLLNSSANTTINHHLPHPQSSQTTSTSKKVKCFMKQPSFSVSTSCVKLRTSREAHSHKLTKPGKRVVQSSVRGQTHACCSSTEYYSSRDAGKVRPWFNNHSQHIELPKLKPCLKKDKTHDARSRNLRVRFDFECHDHDHVHNPNFTPKITTQ
ncbi:hypothetical protein RJT34_20624 [Clitoria ternatea]|uniref:Uncharacterized protein n=1 Tax=Clitoria ternatea TaxID=43366 RepID=A0AAN9P5E6_CLITE